MAAKKQELEKFPYGTASGLTDAEAKENFIEFWKKYGPITLRVGLFVVLMSTSALAADTLPAPSSPGQCAPAPNPASPTILPATKELLGVAAVGIVCAAAVANPVTALGIAACLLTVAAKAANKL